MQSCPVRAHDGVHLAVNIMPALDAPVARVLIVHGYLEHAGRYTPLMEVLAQHRLTSFAPSLRGHGHSEGPRGHILHFEQYTADLLHVLQLGEDSLPWLIVGHSLGGLVALHLWHQQQHKKPPIRAAVLSNPYLAPSLHIPLYKRALGHALGTWVPGLSLPAGITPAQLTSDPAEQRLAAEDPLITTRARARWFLESQRAQRQALSWRRLPGPLLLLLGADDPVACPHTSKRWFEQLSQVEHSELHIRPGERHEVFKERGRAALMQQVAGWLRHRAQTPP